MIDQHELPFLDETAKLPSTWRDIDDEVYVLIERGQVSEAKRVASVGVQEARDSDETDSVNKGRLLYCLEVKANLFSGEGDFGAAQEDLSEAIALVNDDDPGRDGTLGRLFGSLGYVLECLDQEEDSIEAYESALKHLRREEEPAVVDLIRLSNNLAFIYSARNDFDQAETLYLKALKVAHDKLGPSAPDSTGVFNNIGALYQKAGHLEQAREMHSLALEGRKEDGTSNSDLGQSHGNLAIVCAEEGEEEESREHFEDAMKAYTNAGPEWAEDFEAICSNYMQLLRNVGDVETEQRVSETLSKGLS